MLDSHNTFETKKIAYLLMMIDAESCQHYAQKVTHVVTEFECVPLTGFFDYT